MSKTQPVVYRGRFAPSPTGPLHAGSITAALASFLDARAHQGQWLVRMEDLDPPRESAEAASAILHALETLGLQWDGRIAYQSERHYAYTEAITELKQLGLTFNCRCSRRDLASSNGCYPGTCRQKGYPESEQTALRCKVDSSTIQFEDYIQGAFSQNLERDVGDFIIQRKDKLFAYQLAVVIDDAWQGITHIVRGIDLLDSTPRQRYLQKCLNLPLLQYAHIPVIIGSDGTKLSKQNHAPAIDLSNPASVIWQALMQLQQYPPRLLEHEPVDSILDWAIENWNPAALKGIQKTATTRQAPDTDS